MYMDLRVDGIIQRLAEIERRTDVLWEQGISDPDLLDRFAMAVAPRASDGDRPDELLDKAKAAYDLAAALMQERQRRRAP